MANWRNRPRPISEISIDTPWLVAIDESGTPDLKYSKKFSSPFSKDDYDKNNIHFNVTACIMNINQLENSRDKIMSIKNKFWENGCYSYKNNDRRVCFHQLKLDSVRMLLISLIWTHIIILLLN